MANYSSYKIVQGDQFVGAAVTATKFSGSPNSSYGVKWFFGTMCRCSPGCCCLWTAPSDVQNMWIQMWGAGGNGVNTLFVLLVFIHVSLESVMDVWVVLLM